MIVKRKLLLKNCLFASVTSIVITTLTHFSGRSEISVKHLWRNILHSIYLWVFLACFPWSALAQPSAEDRLQALYSDRLNLLPNGEPEISVGISWSQDRITLLFHGSSQMSGLRPEESLRLEKDAVLNIDVAKSTPAKTKVWLSVATLAEKDDSRIQAIREKWKSRGVDLELKRIGAMFAIHGQVIRNRRYLLVAGPYKSRWDAQHEELSWWRRWGERAHLHEELLERPTGRLLVRDADGAPLLETGAYLSFSPVDPQGRISAVDVDFDIGFKNKRGRRTYRGSLYVTIGSDGKLVLGNVLPLEDVAMGTVPAEIFSTAPMEALKAQAVAARGQLLVKLGLRHLADPFQVCASQHCQVYAGALAERDSTTKAVRETRGEFLFLGQSPVDTVYSAHSGGHTEDNEVVWNQTPSPALRGVPDGDPPPGPLDNPFNLQRFLDSPPMSFAARSGYNSKRLRWTRTVEAEVLDTEADKQYGTGRILGVEVMGRGVSGRMKGLKLRGTKREIIVWRELPIRRLFGNLPSALAVIEEERDERGQILRYHIRGAGFGHGVGMCQTGAIGRAKAGQDYRQILRAYYGGAELKNLY